MSNISEITKALERYLRPACFPVGIKLQKPGEAPPPRVKRPRADLGIQVALCQAIAYARRYGWTLAVTEADLNCPLALTAFGFKPELSYYSDGCACAGMYTETEDAGARTEAAVPKFSFRDYGCFVAGPLARLEFEPDVVVQYGNSAQVMRLLQAALFREGGYLSSRFSGRLDCADIVVETIKTQKPQVILPCYGDRIFAQTDDTEMAFSFPWSLAGEIVRGLEGTHKGGVRYPVPAYLHYAPRFPAHYERMHELWAAGGDLPADTRGSSR
jgi:uncharacterized protein (DUF169 family)